MSKFYYKGNFYPTFEEFMKASIEHMKSYATEKDMHKFFEDLARTVWLNMEAYQVKISNEEVENAFEEILGICLKTLMKDIFVLDKKIEIEK